MRSVRVIAFAFLLALVLGLVPATAAPAAPGDQHLVTLFITSLEVRDDLDWPGCGEFNDLSIEIEGHQSDVLPSATVEEWTNLWGPRTTFSLCTGSTYPVSQDLDATYLWTKPWKKSNLGGSNGILYPRYNRVQFVAHPGGTVEVLTHGTEVDPLSSHLQHLLHDSLKVPAANTWKPFTFAIRMGAGKGTDALLLKGSVQTSQVPVPADFGA